jgi:hypothetical protein
VKIVTTELATAPAGRNLVDSQPPAFRHRVVRRRSIDFMVRLEPVVPVMTILSAALLVQLKSQMKS